MAVFRITLRGDESDIEFMRERFIGAIEDQIGEYEQNLDGDIEVDGEWTHR